MAHVIVIGAKIVWQLATVWLSQWVGMAMRRLEDNQYQQSMATVLYIKVVISFNNMKKVLISTSTVY